MNRASKLADRFQAANQEMSTLLEGIDDDRWRRPGVNLPGIKFGEGESRPIGVIADHVVDNFELIMGRARAMADGLATPPLTMADIDAANARHAVDRVGVGRAETIVRLREAGALAEAEIRTWSDEQLDRQAVGRTETANAGIVLERVMIGHVTMHLESIRAALGA